ncbi:hypothetical protein EDE12_12031 [Methylosinus sp. sav-2]|uniref:hypothetical protein n=1 Tax=Methylosinus sp. sav-2 TaxID=2485168 RepID=UPI0004792CC5|nr:hypothetical protein [Methylosinus sp. sav-2]TDX60507.1 hypothetical protein EDE12_12031 [Methylosinus sp. sav-2]
MTNDSLTVLDHGEPIAISFADILKYHGRSFIGGAAHGFKAMQRAFPLLCADGRPERYEVTIATAFPGPGGRDAIEMATRSVTGGRYTVDLDLGGADVVESPRGRYFFRFAYRGASVDVTLRPGVVRAEFIELSRRGPATPDEKERLEWLKQDMADRLMSLPAEEAYDAAPHAAS